MSSFSSLGCHPHGFAGPILPHISDDRLFCAGMNTGVSWFLAWCALGTKTLKTAAVNHVTGVQWKEKREKYYFDKKFFSLAPLTLCTYLLQARLTYEISSWHFSIKPDFNRCQEWLFSEPWWLFLFQENKISGVGILNELLRGIFGWIVEMKLWFVEESFLLADLLFSLQG